MLLTIAIPTYNRYEQLRSNISGILVQAADYLALNELEILVVDNCSTNYCFDDLCHDFRDIKNLHIHRNFKNLGIDGNVRECIKKAKGKFIWFLGDDDRVANSGIKIIFQTLQMNPSIGVCVVNYSSYDHRLEKLLKKDVIRAQERPGSEILANLTFISSTIIRRDFDIHINNFDKYVGSLYYHMSLACYLARSSEILFCKKSIVDFRSCSSELGAQLSSALEPFRIYKEVYSCGIPVQIHVKKYFFNESVYPYFKHHSKHGTVRWSALRDVIGVYGYGCYILKICILLLVPCSILMVFSRCKAKL